MPDRVRYAELLPHEVVARRRALPVAYLPLGVLEFHADHAAQGLDGLKAEGICDLAAQSGGFAFPTLWYGDPRLAGLIEVSLDPDGEIKRRMGLRASSFSEASLGATSRPDSGFYAQLILHVLRQIASLEMAAICVLAGHTPLRELARPAVESFNATSRAAAFVGTETDYWPEPEVGSDHELRRIAFSPAPVNAQGTTRSTWYRPTVGEDHAGYWETSVLAFLRPDSVDLSVYGPADTPGPGIFGIDPRLASKAVGRRAAEAVARGMAEKARALLASSGDGDVEP